MACFQTRFEKFPSFLVTLRILVIASGQDLGRKWSRLVSMWRSALPSLTATPHFSLSDTPESLTTRTRFRGILREIIS